MKVIEKSIDTEIQKNFPRLGRNKETGSIYVLTRICGDYYHAIRLTPGKYRAGVFTECYPLKEDVEDYHGEVVLTSEGD